MIPVSLSSTANLTSVPAPVVPQASPAGLPELAPQPPGPLTSGLTRTASQTLGDTGTSGGISGSGYGVATSGANPDTGFLTQWLAQESAGDMPDVTGTQADRSYRAAGGQSAQSVWNTTIDSTDDDGVLPPSTGAMVLAGRPVNIVV